MAENENKNPCFICYNCNGLTYFSPFSYTKVTLLHEMGRVDNGRDVIITCKECGKKNMVWIANVTSSVQQGKEEKSGWGHD